jgi:hypothetical protein
MVKLDKKYNDLFDSGHFDIHDQLVHAIKNKQQIYLRYKKSRNRLFLPHILYVNSHREEIVEGYQLSGYSEHPLPAWRQFDVKNITLLQILPQSFRAVSNIYNPSSSRYQIVVEKV